MYKFIDPQGNTVKLKKGMLAKYCRERSLPYQTMYSLCVGELITYKGHKSLHKNALKRTAPKAIIVNLKTKETIAITSPYRKSAPFHEKIVSFLIHGHRLHHNDWVLKETADLIEQLA